MTHCQYNVLKSDSSVDGSKVRKKDRLLGITFYGTDVVRLAITFNGKWVSRREKNWEPNDWLILKFYGIFLCTLISQNVIFYSLALLQKNYSIDFHGRGTELLEIYSSMAGRVVNIKNISLNNFKMVKSTKKT